MLSRTRTLTQTAGRWPVRAVMVLAIMMAFVASVSWHSAMPEKTGFGGFSVEGQIADINGNPHGTADSANDKCMANGQCSFTGVIAGTPFIESPRARSVHPGADELTIGRAYTPEAPPPKTI